MENVVMNFQKINEYSYQVEVPDVVLDYVDNVMDKISLGKLDSYEENLNINIENQLYSRIVAACYLKQFNNVVPEGGFLRITANLGDRALIMSVGCIEDENNGIVLLNGVIY